ncbi:MAG: acetate/propionate family kinase [Deltaproteobacteria bacterium]|nr:acetate/propionate family kinase [Deltaproteobacteria bacterium]
MGVDPAISILSLNSGSSSLKFALYKLEPAGETLLVSGAVERIGLAEGLLWVRGADRGRSLLLERKEDFPDHEAAVDAVFGVAARLRLPEPGAVGHRVVHGGADHTAPERVDARLLADLRALVPLAPLHLPGAVAGIEAVAARFPDLPQAACFDTAFHRRLPELAQRFALPAALWQAGVRRYGFHGLSYEYVLEALGDAARGRVVIAHLGNGASMAAVRDGIPVDTTMGFTPAGGLMMGTRSGDLDPGVLIHLMRERGWSAAEVERLVSRDAGLLGVSGLSPDMKTLLEARAQNPQAALAVDLFCYQARKHIGALAAALGGLDTLVFTGGIGERAAPVRQQICEGLAHLGIEIDPERNQGHSGTISTPRSRCAVRVIPTDEDLMIARHTRRLLFPGGAGKG